MRICVKLKDKLASLVYILDIDKMKKRKIVTLYVHELSNSGTSNNHKFKEKRPKSNIS